MSQLLRLATAGSVDDGRSTGVGRLLYDTESVLANTRYTGRRQTLDCPLRTFSCWSMSATAWSRKPASTHSLSYRHGSTTAGAVEVSVAAHNLADEGTFQDTMNENWQQA